MCVECAALTRIPCGGQIRRGIIECVLTDRALRMHWKKGSCDAVGVERTHLASSGSPCRGLLRAGGTLREVALAEQTAKREAAERETKATRTRVLYLLAAVATLVVLLVASTAMNVIMTTRGTTKVVEKYHYTETRGDVFLAAWEFKGS